MLFMISLVLVETLFDHIVDRVKRNLVGARTIQWARVDDDLVVFNEDMVDTTVRVGVNIGVGVGVGVDVGGGIYVGAGIGGQSVGDTSYSRCSDFLCEKFKKRDDDSIIYLQKLSEVVNGFKYKRGRGGRVILSNKIRHPYTP
ncbi:hypothetical protein MTR67_027116 [Solanum verrucosum]|uniref:Uncharacterized protein n=1 Tax=Solanum verrucosum TaxID=315347 RepID=A0AAF0R8J5_SOLVR|nr:hypothetical protein MTR67_027116 [Solanum verrucosum]